MTQYKELRGDLTVVIPVPSAAAAAAGGGSVIVPHKAVITAAKWIPGAAITAHGTNFFTLSFRNRVAGAGTAQWATARAYSATNGVVSTPETLTLSATAANLAVAAGDVLAVEITHAASGLACPGGAVVVTLRSAG